MATSHVIRRSRRNAPTFLTLEEAEAEFQHESVEVAANLEKARARLLMLIHRLEPLDRQLMLAYLENMTAERIGEVTGLSLALWVIVLARIDAMRSRFTQHEIEEQIRQEFQAAFDELERASQEEKADAAERLKRATRRLYDFVRNRKRPQDSQLKSS